MGHAAVLAALIHAAVLTTLTSLVDEGAPFPETEALVIPVTTVEIEAQEPLPTTAPEVSARPVRRRRAPVMPVTPAVVAASEPPPTFEDLKDLEPPPPPAADPPPPPAPKPAALATIGLGEGVADNLPSDPALARFLEDVKHRVRETWRPSDVYRRLGVGTDGPQAGRYTVLRLRVGADGKLEDSAIDTGSGLQALDDEARSAVSRLAALPPPPVHALDQRRGYSFRFGFYLDLSLFHFLALVKEAVAAQWEPSLAFRFRGDHDRTTVVRLLLTFEGAVAHAGLVASSGMDVLDGTALSACRRGLRLGNPPAALGEIAGLVPVRVGFVHRVRGDGEIRVSRDPDAMR